MGTRYWAWALLLFAAPLTTGMPCGPAGGSGPSRSARQEELSSRAQEEGAPSPSGDRRAIVQLEDGRPAIWVVHSSGGTKRLISRAGKDQGLRNPAWSPDGALIAFESYDLQGHSPMTTTHVWVARADGSDLRRVDLPGPNERFSTYLAGWVAADSLKIRADLLRPDDICYVYHFSTKRMEEIPC